MKINFKKINWWIYFTIAILVIIIFSYSVLFLYYNFYRTITQENDIITLRKNVQIEYLNMNKFNQIVKKLEEKIAPPKNINTKNLFR